jgi:hypothetical protein
MLGIELRIVMTELVVIDRLLKLLVARHQIEHSHFFYKNVDMDYSENINFKEYFSTPSTSYLHLKRIFLEEYIEDAIIIISGDKDMIDFIIEFQAESLTNKETNNIKNFILESDINISDKDIEVIYEEY